MENFKREVHQPTTTRSNFIVIKDEEFGDFLFGCPPEVVKYFNKTKTRIPSNIVIPQRTFSKGRNYFDLEFVVYTIVFFQKEKNLINIACTEYQEERIRVVLHEALFGPSFKEVFNSFLMASLGFDGLNSRQKSHAQKLSTLIGEDGELLSKFNGIMALNSEDKSKILRKINPIIRKLLKNRAWVDKIGAKNIYSRVSNAYVKAAMLKREMEVFAICGEDKRDEFINSFLKFNHFDPQGRVELTKNGKKLKITQTNSGNFKLYKKGRLVDSFKLSLIDENRKPAEIAGAPFDPPEFGVTFLGSGTGFDPETNTSCLLIWINGKAIAVDLLANCEEHFRRLGIASSDITHIFLTHLHADHDAGVLEKIMLGRKMNFLTSDLIFDSFLRKAEALTRFDKERIKEFVQFTNVDTGKEIRIPGIEGASIIFDYAFHSIPTGRFRLKYKSLSGKEFTIGFSGDTKFDKKMVDNLHKEGKITKTRRDDILGFIWDCDLIIHEAGGGMLHTDPAALAALPANIKKKTILTHTDKGTRKLENFCFAREGETVSILKTPPGHLMEDCARLIKDTGLFHGFTAAQIGDLLQNSNIETFSKGKYIFKQGSIGDKMYIILSGFAEIIKEKSVVSVYEKGSFLGELSLIDNERKRKASVRAKSELKTLTISRELYRELHLSTVIRERVYDLPSYFTENTPSSLIGYISRGCFVSFDKGDNLFSFGDKSNDVYILVSGVVDVINSFGQNIGNVSNVEVLGAISLLKHIPQPTTVKVATEHATAICLAKSLFREINEKFPFFYATILKKMEKDLAAVSIT